MVWGALEARKQNYSDNKHTGLLDSSSGNKKNYLYWIELNLLAVLVMAGPGPRAVLLGNHLDTASEHHPDS